MEREDSEEPFQWFSRTSMAPELEKHITKNQTSNGRKVFYDENGEDLRLRQPGFKWSLISERRHQIFDNFKEQFTGIFDEFYEKITGEGSRSQRKSSVAPILPSTKTPGLSRHKSKVPPVSKSKDSEVTQVPPPLIDYQLHTTQEPSEPSTECEPEPEVGLISNATNVTTKTDPPKTTRATQVGRKKALKVVVDESQSSDNDFIPILRATQAGRKKALKVVVDESQSSDDDFIPTLKATRRTTRHQAKVTNKNPEPTPSLRKRPTRACKKNKEAKTSSSLAFQSLVVGVDSKEVIKVKNNRLSRELSATRTRSGSICRVSVERVTVSVSDATPQPQLEECQPSKDDGSNHSEQHANKSPLIDTDSQMADLPHSLGNDNKDAEAVDGEGKVPVLQLSPRPREADCDIPVEMSLARPTPPRPKALKQRKKGARKPASKIKTRAVKLREQGMASTLVVDDLPDPTTPTPAEPPPSNAAYSIYESCVSRLETPPNHSPPMETTTLTEIKTPPTVTKPSPPQRISPSRETQAKENSPDAERENMSSPPVFASPSPPSLSVAPSVSAPSYLTGTPHTLLKLREEYQNKIGGKLVSLSELRDSGGGHNGSPLSRKKGSKIPQNSQTPKKDTPSKGSPACSKPISTALPRTPLFHKQAVSEALSQAAIPESTSAEGEVTTPLLRGKRLRSVSMEMLPGCSGESRLKKSTSSGEDNTEEEGVADSPNGPKTDDLGSDSGTESIVSVGQFLVKKTAKPKTFLSGLNKNKPTESVMHYKESAGQPLSFLPRNSPKKVETREEKKAHLADKILKKKQEEEKRREELKNKRQQELQEKIKKREERARKVAEKQAALRQKEEEKKQKLKGQQSQDPTKKLTIKKAREIEEKNKKLKERMMAAEARRKQEEAQQQKRLQQLEDERKMTIELALKRKEMEEEEKKLRRQEKLKQDRERFLKHMEELKGQQEEMKRRIEEDVLRKPQTETLKPPSTNESAPSSKHNELVKQFEKLISGAIAKVPVVATPKIVHVVTGGKSDKSSAKTNKLLQAYYNGSQSQSSGRPASPATSVLSPADSRLNSTFTKDSPSTLKTPISSKTVPTSYQMTPAESDPLFGYENYDIDNLSSEDSTDDEEEPKKELPLWARPDSLNVMMRSQEDALVGNEVDVTKIFPPEQLLKDPDLGKIFRRKRTRFYQRSSSAYWDSPILKRNKVV